MFVTLTVLSVPYPLLFGLWVALVDFLPTIGGALAGIPTVLFALGHSLSAGIVTAVVFLVYTQTENHLLNPVVMSKTVRVNPLLVFIAVLVGADVGAWLGGNFSAFVGILVAVPIVATIQAVVQEVRNLTEPGPIRPRVNHRHVIQISAWGDRTSVSRPPAGRRGWTADPRSLARRRLDTSINSPRRVHHREITVAGILASAARRLRWISVTEAGLILSLTARGIDKVATAAVCVQRVFSAHFRRSSGGGHSCGCTSGSICDR